jgi:hypothetical protein
MADRAGFEKVDALAAAAGAVACRLLTCRRAFPAWRIPAATSGGPGR